MTATVVPPLDRSALRRALEGEAFVTRLVVLETVGSTNDELRRLAADGAAAGTVVVADAQSAGRGRLGRSWHSPPGLGLYLSVLLRPRRPVEELTRWTLAAAVAACEACRTVCSSLLIKWPNDLVWSGRKLGGVLAEARSSRGTVDLVLGAGINVLHRARDFPTELTDRATSLFLATGGVTPNRELLAAAYLRGLAGLSNALAAGAWSEVARRFEELAPGTRGRAVQFYPAGHVAGAAADAGITQGLDERGALRVRSACGTTRAVHLGESLVDAE